nr:hypothetical protein [uncultured Flavobacterium sp.]
MNKEFKNKCWYKELDSHIKHLHASSGNRKTILINREKPFLYLVVTRVNFLTTNLWIEHVNSIIKGLDSNKFESQRFCWLTEQKKYRQEYLKKIINFVSVSLPTLNQAK